MKIDGEKSEVELPVVKFEPDDIQESEIHSSETATRISIRDDKKGNLIAKKDSVAWLQYLIAPGVFLMVTLLGGLRLSSEDNAFLFLKPALICLIFSTFLLILFFRAGLIDIRAWLSESLTPLQNTANGFILATLFAASTQVFNALIPEQGIAFWIVTFFFLWSLWTNLFAEFESKKLLISLGSLFAMAFLVKFLILSNLTAPGSGGMLNAVISGNVGKETITFLLDLPRYSAGTGYIQFFTVILYLIGLILLPREAVKSRN